MIMTSVTTTSISILIRKVRKALRVRDWTEVVELGETWEKEVTSMIQLWKIGEHSGKNSDLFLKIIG